VNVRLDELYLRWLYSQISPVTVKNPERTYWLFARDLFRKEFVWYVPNDDNRIADGLGLRDEFLEVYDIEADEDWLRLGCSMLELLVALSRRFAFMSDGEPRDRFWEMVNNLGIEKCDDKRYRERDDLKIEIDRAMDTIIWRTYNYNGNNGGLFPVENPYKDQRKTEIWLQMAAYVTEKEGD
jgi:hypothetical protein